MTLIGNFSTVPTRLLARFDPTVQLSTSWSGPVVRLHGGTLEKNLGHDVLTRCVRDPALPATSALNASHQCGQDDMHGFAGRARLETHHAAKHSACRVKATKSWRAALTSRLRASCTGCPPGSGQGQGAV